MVLLKQSTQLQPLIKIILILLPYEQLELVMIVLQSLFKAELKNSSSPLAPSETLELMGAAQSSTQFWDNPYDDEDWNEA